MPNPLGQQRAREQINALRGFGRKATSLDTPEMSLGETIADIGLGFVPGVGTPQALRDLERARRDGDTLGMVLSAAGTIPVVGGAAAAVNKARKGGKALLEAADTSADIKRAAAAERADRAEERLLRSGGFATLKGQDRDRAVAAVRAKAEKTAIPRKSAALRAAAGGEDDIAASAMTNAGYRVGGAVPHSDFSEALASRALLRQEPAVTPGPGASEADWAAWGQQHGVNMTRSPDMSLGVSDLTTRKEITVPGGLDGTFTIPDLFHIKGNNFDPNALPQETHNALMRKFLRTYDVPEPDNVDTFNRLNFALLSPNAPLTQNEFLAQRFRLRDEGELAALAGREGEEGLSRNLSREKGVGAALSGGMGVLGTADLGNQAVMARLIQDKPEMFSQYPGETVRDVTLRVMNQVPGLSSKTASLGTPWLDLQRGNTSAVDLHMIRNSYDRMLDDPQVGPAFTQRLAGLLGVEATPDAIRALDPKVVEKAAINIIGGSSPSQVYRDAKTGALVAGLRSQVSPEKLAYEPKTITDFNPFYNRVVDFVDESRGPTPDLPLFPEQWRLWDGYRQRVEPHEFAHPDFRKLPRQSFSEMQDALRAHKEAGYMDTGEKAVRRMQGQDWRKLYYGNVDPRLLLGMGSAAALAAALRQREAEEAR